jgi:hypothetical protein
MTVKRRIGTPFCATIRALRTGFIEPLFSGFTFAIYCALKEEEIRTRIESSIVKGFKENALLALRQSTSPEGTLKFLDLRSTSKGWHLAVLLGPESAIQLIIREIADGYVRFSVRWDPEAMITSTILACLALVFIPFAFALGASWPILVALIIGLLFVLKPLMSSKYPPRNTTLRVVAHLEKLVDSKAQQLSGSDSLQKQSNGG